MRKRNNGRNMNGVVSLSVLLVMTCVLCMVVPGCTKKKQEKTKSIAQIQREQGIPVRVDKMVRSPLQAVERKGGTVEGVYQTVVSSGMPGTIRSIKVKVGSRVKKSAVLASIDPDGGSPYTAAKAAYEYAENAYNRAQSLHQEGAVSQEMLEGAKTQFEAAKQRLQQVVEAVNVLAPFSGTVIEVFEPLNKKVGPGAKLVKLARLDKVRIELKINEALINRFEKGQRAFILMDNDTLWGTVTKVAIGASDRSHSFPVTTLFDNREGKIKPGMYVTVHVITESKAAVISLQMETVSLEDGRAFVYVVHGDKARKTPVELGMRGDSRFEIKTGLNEGDLVVVSGASLLSDGSRVKIIQ